MANIDLEIQPSTKGNDPKNPAHRLSLTLQKNSADEGAKVRFYIPTIPSDGEKVKPSNNDENPSNGDTESGSPPADEPKAKGKSRLSLILLILKIVAVLIVVIGIVNLVLWVVISPRKMKFYVTDAMLEEFSLSDDKTLHYNLRLNFTIRNPNKRIGFRYESIVGGAYYNNEKFDSGNLLPFHQPPKTTTVLDTWFSGARSLSLDMDAVKEFKEHKSSRVYPIDLMIRVYSSIKLGKIHIGDFKVKIKCGLKVPLSTYSNGDGKSLTTSTLTGFKITQCHVDFNPLIVIYSD